MDNPNYYAIIPANVRYDKRLKANEKLLYGEITALAQKDGTCWANNDYFAKLYGVRKEQVSRWISTLIEHNYLKSIIIYKDGTREIDKRYLSIIICNSVINDRPPIVQIDNTYCGKKQEGQEKRNTSCENTQGGHAEKRNTPIAQKRKENSTSMNNTSLISKDNHLPPDGVLVEDKKVEIVENLQTVSDNFQTDYRGDTSKTQKTSKVRKPAAPPPEFNYDGFDEADKVAIETWFAYCKEVKKSHKSEIGLEYLRDGFLELKASNMLVGAIKHSIRSQYRTVFAPSVTKYNSSPQKKTASYVHDFTNNKPSKQVDML